MLPLPELTLWLRVSLTPYLGPVGFHALRTAFGSMAAILAAAPQDLIPYLSPQRRQQVASGLAYGASDAAVHAALAWLGAAPNRAILTLPDRRYPAALAHDPMPSPTLFAQGDLASLHPPAIALVGSRHPTPQGRDNAHRFAKALAELEMTVVSGFAAGIDTAAHEGALAANGRTIAVLGTGIDRVYPAHNRRLVAPIGERGLLLSEYSLGTAPLPANFPRRNRLIASLSLATLVVEARRHSGSLITARLAAELNREVMAIPGSIHNPEASGCHYLLKQGAALIENIPDLLAELPLFFKPLAPFISPTTPTPPATTLLQAPPAETLALLNAMGFDPVHPDGLTQKLGIPAADVYAQLLQLELSGIVHPIAGGRFQRLS
ncbi:MAG: DNA-processing protein DprA [Neisseriaceae bacterium]|nr:DNA-processing protein DprA [Neisseriaceae bacterium]